MRRTKRNKRNIHSKLGLLFIVLILSLTSISASYAHWQEILNIEGEMETTEWEEKDLDFRIGYEDLPIVICYEGCSHGFWGHNGKDKWEGYSHDDTVGSVFSNAAIHGLQDDTLLEALGYSPSGPPCPAKFAKILLIQAVAALLNTAHSDVNYPLSLTELISQVNTALAGTKDDMEKLKDELDKNNNLGGDLCGCGGGCKSNNDFDYNDFVVDVDINGFYIQGILTELNFTFEALARGAAYHHDFKIHFPANTFGKDGNYALFYYNTDGSLMSIDGGPFDDDFSIDLDIFKDTWLAMPPNSPGPHSFSGNTVDGSGAQPGRKTVLTFNFSGFFGPENLDLDTYTLNYIGIHGSNLFFDPILYVWNTGENVDKGDVRFIPTPKDWIWPQERAPIWDVYPYNTATTEGVKQGNPPIFTLNWYTEAPTALKWDP